MWKISLDSPLISRLLNARGIFSQIVIFIDVSVAVNETKPSLQCFYKTGFPCFPWQASPRCSDTLSGLWWQLLLLTFFLSGEADPFGSRAAHLIVGHDSQQVGSVGLQTAQAGCWPRSPVLCLRLAGGAGGVCIRRARPVQLELIAGEKMDKARENGREISSSCL